MQKNAQDKNIPDGEVYSAPVRNSVNGTISYNAPTLYNGITFENIKFTFKDGKIVEASSNDTKRLNDILDSDEGARHIGEFAIGFNPHILHPMKDILFDEKLQVACTLRQVRHMKKQITETAHPFTGISF